MHTPLMTVVFAAAAAMSLHAQAPQTTSTHQQPPDDRQPTITLSTSRATPANPSMTISGCLTQREGASGAALKAGERGMPQDYILTDVKMSPSSTVSGIGVSTKYQIVGISDVELKKHLNHHVELIGQIVPPGSTGQPADDTPDFQATTLKMVSLACNAAQ